MQKNTSPPRRKWIKRVLGIVGILLLLPPLFVAAVLLIKYNSELVDTVGKVSFDRPLPIPALANASVESDGTRVFDLETQEGETSFFDDKPTKTWGVNGSYLGPTLRAKRGEKVRINLKNSLPETTTMHWHGMHVPAQMDGGPHQPVGPGATWSPHWTISQPAATLWYHPHPHGETAKHVYRGIAGMFIIDDENEATLPKEYGTNDIPVIIQDKRFDTNRQLDFGGTAATGITGSEVLVNGARTPHLKVGHERLRLRLLNASNARIYNLAFSDSRTIMVIGSDGGLLKRPVDLKNIKLSPGERVEVVVTFQPGERVVLRSLPQDLKAGLLNQRAVGGDDSLDIMEFRAGDNLAPAAQVPEELAPMERLKEADVATKRSLTLSGFEINGQTMDMNRIDFTTNIGDTELWEVKSIDGTPHNFHVHDVRFQILEMNGHVPPPELQGWKDTVMLLNGDRVKLLMRFEDYTDNEYPYMFHCHLLLHEDRGMMGQFLVLRPGETPDPKRHEHESHHH